MTTADADTLQARRIAASQIRLTVSHPFFAALLMMAPVRITDSVETAATDGQELLFNPAFMAPLSAEQLDGLVVHEVLHCALMHIPRRRGRDRLLWNIAADIHVNGLIGKERHLCLPEGAVVDTTLEHLSADEIYEVLRKEGTPRSIKLLDLPAGGPPGVGQSEAEGELLEVRWKAAIHRAIAAASLASSGRIPERILREFRAACEPTIDWKSQLWRWLVRTPDDFQGFDRRFAWRRIYLEQLEGESIQADVCIDTSGSVNDEQLGAFLSELRGILRAYPTVRCRLWYADCECHGPFEIDDTNHLPEPIGGGGTDFRPFLERAEADSAGTRHSHEPRLLVYLTDGHGTFPTRAPNAPVMWAVVPGGLESSKFPFGTVVRMI
jgi:predicted metal-dependent peptidase